MSTQYFFFRKRLKEGKTTWIEMDTFPLIYTTLPTKIKYLRLP